MNVPTPETAPRSSDNVQTPVTAEWSGVASPGRPAFYGEVISSRRRMLTVRSEIGPYRYPVTALFRVRLWCCIRQSHLDAMLASIVYQGDYSVGQLFFVEVYLTGAG